MKKPLKKKKGRASRSNILETAEIDLSNKYFFYDELFFNFCESILIISIRDGKVLKVNKSLAEFLNTPISGLLNKRYDKAGIILNAQTIADFELMLKSKKRNFSINVFFSFRKKNYSGKATMQIINYNNLCCVLVIFTDMSVILSKVNVLDRKLIRLEKENIGLKKSVGLQKSEINSFYELLDLYEINYWEYDIKKDIYFLPSCFFDLKEKSLISISGKDFINMIPEGESSFVSLYLNNSPDKKNQFIQTITSKSGFIKYFEFRVLPDNKGKEILKIKGTMSDVSETVGEIFRLKGLIGELEKSNKNKDKFFSIIAHDLRGPFAGLLGFSKILNDDFEVLSREDIKSYINIISTSLKTVFNLVENLLQWSKVQCEEISYTPERLNLGKIVQPVINALRPELESKNISLINEIGENCFIKGDENMLRSVLLNLINNSVKYSGEGSRIVLSTDERADAYEISVSDTGKGMTQEKIDNLFRIDKLYSSGLGREKGGGLGLLLCNEFVKKHNSKLQLKSEYGIGTTFYFKINKAD